MKKYYRKGEIAKELKVFPSTIGYWEKFFCVPRAKYTASGAGLYDAAGLSSFREINRLVKVEKYTLEGAKRQLNGGV